MGGTRRKIRALGCDVDALTMVEALEQSIAWVDTATAAHKAGTASSLPGRFIVTPNLDHAVLLKSNTDLRAAYKAAALVLADGMPLVWASKLYGRPLPERVAGSDLAPNMLRDVREGTKVFFLGASEESSQKAVKNVRLQYPHVDIVGRLSPPMGFEKSNESSQEITQQIRESQAVLIVVGLGAPKQELWVHKHCTQLPGTVSLCVGATIDFLAGTVKRAPAWTHQLGVEWVHRMLSDPRRLVARYSRDALALPGLIFRDLTLKSSQTSSDVHSSPSEP